MAFDHPMPPRADRRLSIVSRPGGWAIMHGDGFLGVAADREEALRLLRTLEGAAAEPSPRAR